jgi:hypothetical protein
MPSALDSSRRFVAEALARVRSGLEGYDRNLDQPGAEIQVEPFDSQNVSTPAALVKLATSIGAARRRAANARAAQQDVELGREKTRAEIARLRAEAAYALGQGRQSGAGSQPKVLESDVGPYKKGTAISDVNVDLANRRLQGQEHSRGVSASQTRRLSAAKTALADIDSRIKRDTLLAAQKAFITAEPVFKEISMAGEKARPQALAAVGIDPNEWARSYSEGGFTSSDRARIIANARKDILDQYVRKYEIQPQIRRYYEPQRKRYQSIIDQYTEGDLGAEEADPNDPLGMNPLGLDLGGE